MATSPALLSPERALDDAGISLLVTWQDPKTRRYEAVGVLSRTEETYHFRYLDETHRPLSFLPFLGFDQFAREYRSPHLFPLFAERVLDESRPDRLSLFHALDLVATAGPMEFLGRSGGRRGGDAIELLPIPEVHRSHTQCIFLVHGIRYQPGASEAIDQLTTGQALDLVREPDNEYDPRAVLVTSDGSRLGWVPNPLVDYVGAILSTGDARLTVVRANPSDFGHHMRLLVRVEGRLPDGYELPWGPLNRSRLAAPEEYASRVPGTTRRPSLDNPAASGD